MSKTYLICDLTFYAVDEDGNELKNRLFFNKVLYYLIHLIITEI